MIILILGFIVSILSLQLPEKSLKERRGEEQHYSHLWKRVVDISFLPVDNGMQWYYQRDKSISSSFALTMATAMSMYTGENLDPNKWHFYGGKGAFNDQCDEGTCMAAKITGGPIINRNNILFNRWRVIVSCQGCRGNGNRASPDFIADFNTGKRKFIGVAIHPVGSNSYSGSTKGYINPMLTRLHSTLRTVGVVKSTIPIESLADPSTPQCIPKGADLTGGSTTCTLLIECSETQKPNPQVTECVPLVVADCENSAVFIQKTCKKQNPIRKRQPDNFKVTYTAGIPAVQVVRHIVKEKVYDPAVESLVLCPAVRDAGNLDCVIIEACGENLNPTDDFKDCTAVTKADCGPDEINVETFASMICTPELNRRRVKFHGKLNYWASRVLKESVQQLDAIKRNACPKGATDDEKRHCFTIADCTKITPLPSLDRKSCRVMDNTDCLPGIEFDTSISADPIKKCIDATCDAAKSKRQTNTCHIQDACSDTFDCASNETCTENKCVNSGTVTKEKETIKENKATPPEEDSSKASGGAIALTNEPTKLKKPIRRSGSCPAAPKRKRKLRLFGKRAQTTSVCVAIPQPSDIMKGNIWFQFVTKGIF